MRCVELFAGMGAMSLGLSRAGFEHDLLVESDAACVATLAQNGFAPVAHTSVQDVDFARYTGTDVVAGGVPCQPFSGAGKQLGPADARNMWPHAVRCVRECRPRYFLFENSATMRSARHAPYLRSLVVRFEALGYRVHEFYVDAADYGVPQHRKRLLLVGVRHGEPDYAAPSPDASRTSVGEALASLGPPTGCGDHRVHPGAKSYKGHTPSTLARPAKAVVSGVHGCPGGANTVSDGEVVRYFTPRELARLQTLPDTFHIPHVWSTCVKQLGNACPTELVRRFASGFDSNPLKSRRLGETT